jgi:ABC-type amino acid transport substrate-binding protein
MHIEPNKHLIATIDGETAQVIAEADFPKAGKLSMPQMTDCNQMLLNVASKKADVTILEPAFTNQYINHNPGSVENICPSKPIRVFPNCWMFSRGEFEFKAMLDTVLDEVINSGAMDKIISKYEHAPNEIYRVAVPYQLPK